MNSEIKKKPMKPRKPRKPKTTKKKMSKDKSVKQLVNVNVTSSGGGGSGGASIPSAQPSYHPMMYQSSQAEKEANKGLLQSLEQLTKKQDDISALVRSLEKKPEDIQIKERIVEKLNNEDETQGEVVTGLNNSIFESINNDLEKSRDINDALDAERVAYESRGGITSEGEKEKKRILRDQIKELGGTTSNAETLESLKNKLSSLQGMKL